MKKIIFLTLCLLSTTAFGQIIDSTMEIIDYVETAPTFPGGDKELWCSIENNLNYEILNSTKINAKYFIQFIIDTTGYPTKIDFIAIRPSFKGHQLEDSLIKREILRVFNLMPKWNPAELQGIKVPCRYVLAIEIPYEQFKCGEQNHLGNIEYRPDIPAEFIFGQGTTGHERITSYLNSKLQWPSQDDCQGRVIIRCVVKKSGELSNFEVVRKLCPDFDKEALRVVMEMPKWKPAIKNNRKVRSIVYIPVVFKLLM
jgi:TonB family protein